MNVLSAYADFMLAKQADSVSPDTLKWYKSLLTDFCQHFDGCEVASIEARQIRAYIVLLQERDQRYTEHIQKPAQKGGLSPHSIAGHIRALHAFWRWCALEYNIKNPMANIKRPKTVQTEPKAIDKRNFVLLFNATGKDDAGVRDRAMLAFLADTGCRLGGLIRLTWDSINLEQRIAIVTEKGQKQRQIFFTYFTAQLMDLWRLAQDSGSGMVFTAVTKERKALTSEGVHQMLKRLKERAGVSGRINPHSFRHRFAISYLENGGDVITLSKLLGHTDIKTTADFYARFKPTELAVFHEKFTPINRMYGINKRIG